MWEQFDVARRLRVTLALIIAITLMSGPYWFGLLLQFMLGIAGPPFLVGFLGSIVIVSVGWITLWLTVVIYTFLFLRDN